MSTGELGRFPSFSADSVLKHGPSAIDVSLLQMTHADFETFFLQKQRLFCKHSLDMRKCSD
jgi:hypothetical protein